MLPRPHSQPSSKEQPSGAADDAWEDKLGPTTGSASGKHSPRGSPVRQPAQWGIACPSGADPPAKEDGCSVPAISSEVGPLKTKGPAGAEDGMRKHQGSPAQQGRKDCPPAVAGAGKADSLAHGDRPAAEFPILDLPAPLVQEIFQHLDAHDLSVVSCVCKAFHQLAAESQKWENLFTERWGAPLTLAPAGRPSRPKAVVDDAGGEEVPARTWRSLYLDREIRSRAMLGRYQLELLHAHTAPVRCARMLPAAGLAVSAGYDSSVRVWNLEDGLLCASSAPLGETLRAVALDAELLAVAGTDAAVYLWSANPACPHRWDVAGLWPRGGRACRALRGHTGPVSCLGITAASVFSGSWDMSVRAWARADFRLAATFCHADWVWALVCRGSRLVSTAGPSQYTWDVETGRLLRVRKGVHSGLQAYAVEASRSGNAVLRAATTAWYTCLMSVRLRGGQRGISPPAGRRRLPPGSPMHPRCRPSPWRTHGSSLPRTMALWG